MERAALKEDMSIKDEESNNSLANSDYEMPSIISNEDNY